MGIAIPLAIIVGAAIIAAAILFAFRWEVVLGSGQPPMVRLDRWSGEATACNIDPTAAHRADEDHTAVIMDCVAP